MRQFVLVSFAAALSAATPIGLSIRGRHVRRPLRPLLLAMSLVLLMAATVQAAPPDRPIRLTPQQETNKVMSHGRGTFSYTIDGSQLCYTLEVRNLTGNPVGAHIHEGARRVAGGIVVHLIAPPSATSSVQDCITATEGGNLTPAELAAIETDPSSFYVNVHTPQYVPGEIRGQLK